MAIINHTKITKVESAKKPFLIFSIGLILVLALQLPSSAQFVDNKLDIHIGAKRCFLSGDPTLTENGFTMPSLFGNISKSDGVFIKGNYKILPFVSFGLGACISHPGKWINPTDATFKTSKIQNKSIFALARIQTPYAPFDLFNWLNFYGEISPVLGYSTLKLDKAITMAVLSGQGIVYPKEEYTNFFGYRVSAGFKITVSRSVGVFAEYSFDRNFLEGQLFIDKQFGGHSFSGGVFIRLAEVKMVFGQFKERFIN